MKTQLIVSKSCKLELLEEDLIEFEITGEIDETIAKELVAGRKRISEGAPVKLLVSITGLDLLDKDSLEYFASPEAEEGVVASAIVRSESSIIQGSINLFMKFKQGIPTKLFNSREDALKWLSKY